MYNLELIFRLFFLRPELISRNASWFSEISVDLPKYKNPLKKFESQISYADNLHKLPTETLTLIDKDTILPMTEVDGKLIKKFSFFKN